VPYEILPHTADVGVAASAPTIEELFSEAVRGLAAILLDSDPPPGEPGATVRVEADDVALLLAGLLEEALYAYESRGELAVGADVDVAGGATQGIFRVVHGVEASGPAIKAVTYHQLSVEAQPDGWHATVYFDV
jgi:SHS2 domain-containing protein